MKARITRPDGTVLDVEGTAEEIAKLAPAPLDLRGWFAPQAPCPCPWPYWPGITVTPIWRIPLPGEVQIVYGSGVPTDPYGMAQS